jgi:hypothetical protein
MRLAKLPYRISLSHSSELPHTCLRSTEVDRLHLKPHECLIRHSPPHRSSPALGFGMEEIFIAACI